MDHGIENPYWRHRPECRCRPPALPALHGLIEGILVRDIDQLATTVKGRQGRNPGPLLGRAEKSAQSRFDDLGHRALLPCGLALELRHYRIVDVKGCLRYGKPYHRDGHMVGVTGPRPLWDYQVCRLEAWRRNGPPTLCCSVCA